VKNCKNHKARTFYAVEHRIRESRDEGAPYVPVETREHLRELPNSLKRGINCDEEIFSKPGTLPFVPRVGTSQIPSNLPTVDDR
jgi:hypothetical protein